MRLVKFLGVLLVICLLTLITQIGGLLFLVCYLVFRKNKVKLVLSFVVLYLVGTFLLVPLIAPVFGREKIKTTKSVKLHIFLTSLTNRNYVVPQVNDVLSQVSKGLQKSYPKIHIHCLDANFPFWDGFPLLPHLSHNDGKKLDISLIYQDEKGRVVNDKPSRSGYGIFEVPKSNEYDQIAVCKRKGYWQYDFPKYLTLGELTPDLNMSSKATKKLLIEILKIKEVSKVFVEPHLRSRMQLTHPKLRYHGCKAVRHDDHIHLQVK